MKQPYLLMKSVMDDISSLHMNTSQALVVLDNYTLTNLKTETSHDYSIHEYLYLLFAAHYIFDVKFNPRAEPFYELIGSLIIDRCFPKLMNTVDTFLQQFRMFSSNNR